MADSTIDSELFVLKDNWPGVARRVSPDNLPNGDIISAIHHNVETAVFPIGDKIVVRNRSAVAGDDGDATFIYLKGLAITEANPTCAAKQLVVPSLAGTPYQVTNDPDQCLDVTGCPLAAVLLSIMTFTHLVTKYGWFWCGGVAPEAMVAAMGGNYHTDGLVVAGPIVAHDPATADSIGLGPVGGVTEAIIGFAYAADAV
ncbi:MAG TPA: hypothetical protein VMY35_14360 [Phycisphaerae bacterium]|nr:hypothetical protein [Phycisphaerae bacterium]